MSVSARVVAGIAAVLAFADACAHADQSAAPDERLVHVFNFGKAHPQCVRWTDDCRICDAAGCSNIGIACQPNEVRCLDGAPGAPAADSAKPQAN